MKIVIDIPKDKYNWIKEHKIWKRFSITRMLYKVVRSGTEMPRVLGDLIIDGWISTEDQLPENDQTVLMWCQRLACGELLGADYAIGYIHDGYWHAYYQPSYFEIKCQNWMPLPKQLYNNN